MYNILLPVGATEERDRRQAETVSEMPVDPDELTATVLFVSEKIESEVGGTVSSSRPEEVPDSVHTATDVLEDAGITVDAVVAEGDQADTIISFVDQQDIDHVVVAGQRRSPTGKALFGSDIQSIILNTPVPVTVTSNVGEA